LDPEKHYLIITWTDVPYYGCDEGDCEQRNTFQAVLTDGTIREIGGVIMPEGANVLFSYDQMEWTTGGGSGGNMGYGGFPATVGINHSSGVICQDIGTFDRPGRAYYGNTMDLGCPPNEVQSLEGKSLILNADDGAIVDPSFDLTLIGEDHDAGHQLTWKTERPTDWDYFSIEGGTDTSTYTELITIPAESQPQLPLGMFSYQPGQTSQYVWYRVTGITSSGEIQQSNWVEIGGQLSEGFELMNVGPNPMTGPVMTKLQVYESGELQWRLTSMSGQIMNAGTWQVEPGVHQGQLAFAELPAGTYVFTVMG
ncbi:MAG: nidogen-like domain-containing protein, partial [Bacteroidota bacterium]